MSNALFATDESTPRDAIHNVIANNYSQRYAPDQSSGGRAFAEEPTNLVRAERFAAAKLRAAVNDALARCPVAGIDVVSAVPGWVELRVPCDLRAILPLQSLITRLDADLPEEIGEAISYAFHEMLSNAIEHGGRVDPTKRVEIRFMRLRRAVTCWIKDPGHGFDLLATGHAAINNTNDDPLRHVSAREEKGLRAGGFGILLTSQLVDELVYNECHNELLFVKYLD